MKKTEQLSGIWENDFGVEYTRRKLQVHEAEGALRKSFWRDLMSQLPGVGSVTEIGCNAGMNLEAIHDTRPDLELVGIEPNDFAFEAATARAKGRYRITAGDLWSLPTDATADLVFTCTVLIHVAPDDLESAMRNIFNLSRRFILTMEYYWPLVKEIEYRGLGSALWKQDFGVAWLHGEAVRLLETGYLDARDGFDRVTWWLFEKCDASPEEG